MKTSTNTKPSGGPRCLKSLGGIFIAGLLLGVAGCSTTRQVSQDWRDRSGFLGDYSLLREGKGKEANYVYFDTNANWAGYTKVFIKPIELWHSEDPDSKLGKLSLENKQLLVDFLHTSLLDNLTKQYEIVSQPGPGVLIVRAGITEARKSKPVIGLVSSAYLPLRVVSLGKRMITGTDIGVGAVQVEAEFIDGGTRRPVALAMDARAGTQALRSKFSGTWGDVKLVFDFWSERLAKRLSLLKSGDMTAEKL